MNKTPLQILKAARKLISDRSRWTQGQWARDKYSRNVEANDPAACRWCSGGALMVAAKATEYELVPAEARRVLAGEVLGFGVIDFNDSSPHKEVIAAFDRAICKLEATHE